MLPKRQTEVETVECSFCGTKIPISAKGKVVAGPDVFICRDCVGLCIDVMADHDPEWREQKIETLTKLRDKA
jgi:ATP-dependent Clp protease ATP-binding subunit ClpX